MNITYKNKELVEPDFSTLIEKSVLFIMVKNVSEICKSDYAYSSYHNFIDIEVEDNVLMLITEQFSFLFNIDNIAVSNIFKVSFIFDLNSEPIIFEVERYNGNYKEI